MIHPLSSSSTCNLTHGSVQLNLTSSYVRPCYCDPCLSTMQMRINLRGTGGQMTSAHDMAAVVSSKLRALSSKDVYAVAYPSLYTIV